MWSMWGVVCGVCFVWDAGCGVGCFMAIRLSSNIYIYTYTYINVYIHIYKCVHIYIYI